ESFPAFAAYSRGLDATDRGDADKAQAQYQAAVEADPQYQAATSALARLKSRITVHETKQAGDYQSLLATLDPAQPGFGKLARKMFEAGGGKGTYVDRFKRQLEFLAYLAEKGLKPYEETHPRTPVDRPGRKYLEANEVLSLIGAWGDNAEVVQKIPLVMEYLLKKYPDDTELAGQLEHHARRTGELLASGKARPGSNYGESGERAAVVHALLLKLAARHEATLKKADAAPAAAIERVRKTLAAEHSRKDDAFDSDYRARVRALDPKDPKYSDEVGDLIYAIENHPVRERRLPGKIELLDLVFTQNGRPQRGTPDSPVYMELDQLLSLMNRFDKDPDTVALLPACGEYLLAKYPDHPYIASQLKLTSNRITETLQDPERSRKRWKTGYESAEERPVEAQARALFKKIGARAGKK
ncbi:MAG: hypothetical protein ACYC8T_37240, partial [Myxococcaceae bacterium]